MGIVIEISPAQAQHLRDLAQAEGISEEALLQEALELLFRRKAREDALAEDLAVLQSLSKELGPESNTAYEAPPRNPCDYSVTHAVSIRSSEEAC